MVQGTGLYVLVERAISLNRPLRTRTVGGVGAGGEKPLATRLEVCFCIAEPEEETNATASQYQYGSDPRSNDIENAGLSCYGWPHIRVQNFRHLAYEEEANAWQHE